MSRVRFRPCPAPDCPELADACPTHNNGPWAGRTGTTRQAALGVTSAAWTRLRARALRRDRRRCVRCGAPATVVDHLVPVAWRRPPRGFNAHLAQLGCLCNPCHHIKTSREAAIGRQGGLPDQATIDAHVRWWLDQCTAEVP